MNPNFPQFTIKAQEALSRAQEIAASKRHQQVDALHLLIAMLEDANSILFDVLDELKIDSGMVITRAERDLEALPKVFGEVVGQQGGYLTRDFVKY